MKIKNETTYDKEDVGKVLIEQHAKQFGTAPAGYKWELRSTYGEFVVEAIEIESPVENKE